MSTGKILLLIFGSLAVIGGLVLVGVGGAALWANGALTDDEGYYNTETFSIEKDSYAVISEPAIIHSSWWIWDFSDLAKFKVQGLNNDPSKNVFMGLGEEGDVGDYLTDIEHDEVIDLEINPLRLEYRNRPGTSTPAPPTTQTFWAESTHGSGTQTLELELETGRWVLVLMNDDGSASVDLSVVLGVKLPWLFGTGVGFVAGGAVLLVAGIVMVVLAVRRSEGREQSTVSS